MTLIEIWDFVIWWLTLFLLGILTFPIIKKVLRNFGDQSYLFSKIFALVLLTYLTWILSYLFSYSLATVVSALAIILFCSVLVQRKFALRLKLRSVVEGELIFGVIFIFFLLIRAYRPEIGGLDIGMVGEKWMDFAFLNAVGRSGCFPPIDLWFSSRVIDCYYYFGYLTTNILIKITTVRASIGYNLAVATYAALLGSAVFGIAVNLFRMWGAVPSQAPPVPPQAYEGVTRKSDKGLKSCGLIAVLFVLFIGNLGILGPLWVELSKGLNPIQALITPNIAYFWVPSRVVPEGITEFPFFTYILGDLHPHLVAMPFQMLVLGLLLEVFTEKNFFENRFLLLFLPLCMGFLIPLNSWDYFTYVMLLLVIVAMKVREIGIRRSSNAKKILNPKHQILNKSKCLNSKFKTFMFLLLGFWYLILFRISNLGFRISGKCGKWLQCLMLLGGLILASLILFLPFLLEFHPRAIEGIELVKGSRTPIYSLIAMFGLFLFLLFSWLLFSIKKFFDKTHKESFYFVYLLVLVGVAAILIPEVVYFKSGFYSSAVDRGNTIFKFYLQAWLLLGIASAVIACRLKEEIEKEPFKTIFLGMFAVLLIISALYPALAVNSWTGGFGSEPTLDGIGYMKERDDYKGEYQAVEWLNENAADDAIILEAVEDEEHRTDYCRPGRISASTGLQTVIGWPWHEFLWRRDEEVWRRVDDVKAIYSTDNVSLARSLLNKYNVSYVYVGRLERDIYEGAGLVKFESNCFEEVFSKEGIKIYKLGGEREH